MHAQVTPLKVWLATPLFAEQRARIESEFHQVAWLENSDEAARAEELAEADVVYGMLAPADVEKLRAARFIQSVCPLIPEPLRHVCRARTIPIASAESAFIPRTAERTLALLLASRHGLFGRSVEPAGLAGATVTVFGTGRQGQAIARLFQAIGVQVLGVQDHARNVPYFDQVVEAANWTQTLAKSVALICCTPPTADTSEIDIKQAVDALPPASIVVNLSAADVLDLQAFDAASQTKGIRGYWLVPPGYGALPVLPESIVAVPSIVSDPGNDTEVVGLLLRNLHCLQAGLPCENVV